MFSKLVLQEIYHQIKSNLQVHVQDLNRTFRWVADEGDSARGSGAIERYASAAAGGRTEAADGPTDATSHARFARNGHRFFVSGLLMLGAGMFSSEMILLL